MLYEMVTGRPPFLGDDSVAIIGQHINTPPVAPKPGVRLGVGLEGKELVLSLRKTVSRVLGRPAQLIATNTARPCF